MVEICIISVRSKLQKALSPLLLLLASVYIKPLPIGGKLFAPLSPVGAFLFVDLMNFDTLPFPFLSLQCISQFCNKQPPLLGAFIIVVSVI